MNTPLHWAGGKRWLLPVLSELYSTFRTFRLVEPFAGACSATFGLEPSAALCNDTLAPLVNFFVQLKRGLTIPEWGCTKDDFIRLRARFNAISHDSVESAALFYYLNRIGFNGLCRFNSKGGFNVPFGTPKAGRLVALADYADALRNVEFSCADFETLAITADDFVYADPPYDTEFTSYAPGGFSWFDQRRCAHWLAAHTGPVVVSNQATPRIVELYTSLGFSLTYHDAPRRISCNGDRTPAREMLATKGILCCTRS